MHNEVKKLSEKLGTPVESTSEFRFEECPFNGCIHDRNLSTTLYKDSSIIKCFDCGESDHISNILRGSKDYSKPRIVTKRVTSNEVDNYDDDSMRDYASLYTADEVSLTGNYLKSRGIEESTWMDLDYPLKESGGSYLNRIVVYPFINKDFKVVATQSVYVDGLNFSSKKRKYKGKKSQGVGILKDAPKVIISEGLETGLSVRQYLGNDYGLIVCGDAGNLESLAGKNDWALRNRKEIIIATDNDVNNRGAVAARKVFYRFLNKSRIYMPSQVRTDWNDVLLLKRMEQEWI